MPPAGELGFSPQEGVNKLLNEWLPNEAKA